MLVLKGNIKKFCQPLEPRTMVNYTDCILFRFDGNVARGNSDTFNLQPARRQTHETITCFITLS